mgnify:FL=1
MKNIPAILGIVFVMLTACGCDDESGNFRYSPANGNSRVLSTYLAVEGDDVDDAFIAATSGYCEENRSKLKIGRADGNSIKVDFPSPNAFSKKITTDTDTSAVTTASYFSDLTLDGKKLRVKTVFKLEVPNRLKDHYMDFEFHLAEMEIDGKTVKAVPQDSEALRRVTIARKGNGAWELKD